jgi:hypothetical protein
MSFEYYEKKRSTAEPFLDSGLRYLTKPPKLVLVEKRFGGFSKNTIPYFGQKSF